MTSTVRAYKGLLTKRSKIVSDWIQENATLVSTVPGSDPERLEWISDIRASLKVCNDNITLLETTMAKLADAFDDLEEHTADEEVQLNKYIDGAQDTIMKLHLHKAEIERRISRYTETNLTERQNIGPSTKFHGRIQKTAMEEHLQKQQGNSPEWSLERWLSAIDTIITKEETLKSMLPKESGVEKPHDSRERLGGNNCEYCRQKGHRWNSCPKIPSPFARRNFLINTKRCLNCGSLAHQVSSCASGSCRKCNGKHHTAICSKSATHMQEQDPRLSGASSQKRDPMQQTSLSSVPSSKKVGKGSKKPQSSSKQHVVTLDLTEPQLPQHHQDDDAVVLHMKERHVLKSNREKVVLLAGSVDVQDCVGKLRKVIVLLDTGSELSFIDEHLANELGLKVIEKSPLLISTFGSPKSMLKECDVTTLTIRDIEGMRHEVRLHKNDFITGTIEQADLEQRDLDFIAKQDLVLSLPLNQHGLQPQILLGCDYLWNFMVPMTVNGPNTQRIYDFHVLPNQPQRIPPFTITLSSLSVPPTPLLNSQFLTDGIRTAFAPKNYDPPLRCRSWEDASNMTCDVSEDCKCSPAETRMLCDCREFNLTSYISKLEYQLPILRPNLEFRTSNRKLIARILHSTTAEFILRIKDKVSTTAVTSDAICSVQNALCTGCYNCAKGARAQIVCTSSTREERAEIRCGNNAFTVPCSSEGIQSELRFTSDRAKFNIDCTVQCGNAQQEFQIVGTLRYTGSMFMAARRIINGESELYSEINLPDFGHMLDVFLKWSGTLLFTGIAVAIALAVTYFCIVNSACCLFFKLILCVVKLITHLLFRAIRIGVWTPMKGLWQKSSRDGGKPTEKLL
ncbi:zinc knuckle [Ostertagia ostertagi]